MSRYDNYTIQSRELLFTVQELVIRERREESGIGDLAKAFCLNGIQELIRIARSNNTYLNRQRLEELYEQIKKPRHGSAWANFTDRDNPGPDRIRLSNEFRSILDKAETIAGGSSVEPQHLLHAAWPLLGPELAKYFESQETLKLPMITAQKSQNQSFPILEAFGRELTSSAFSAKVFGRDEEIDKLIGILIKYYKPNPLLLGEPGVGKTALVEGLAERIKSGDVPESLKDTRIFEVRISNIAAGTVAHGAFEERLRELIDTVEANPNLIVFLDEIHQISSGYSNDPTADIMKPALARGLFRCIGATTISDYHRFLAKEEALMRRFQTLTLPEPNRATVKTILVGLKPELEGHYDIEIPEPLLESAIRLTGRFIPQRFYPDKALEVIDRACANSVMKGSRLLSEAILRRAVFDCAGIREEALSDTGDPDALAKTVGKSIIGQDAAVREVCMQTSLARKRLGFQARRPGGVFLFTGPSGIGKTALAEALAKALSGSEDALTRVDLSEFSEPHTMARLIGAPPGYIGYGDMPILVHALEKNPAGLLLLDEFEKAHPQVQRLFLQLFDEGRVSDSYGRPLNFTSMTIIATCTSGDLARGGIGFSEIALKADGSSSSREAIAEIRVRDELKKRFSAELLGRFDAIIGFRALDKSDFRKILIEVLLPEFNENLTAEYALSLELDDAVCDFLVERGFSGEYGVRKLKRAFQDEIARPLAAKIESFEAGKAIKALKGEAGVEFLA